MLKKYSGVYGGGSGEVVDLVTATGAGRDNGGVGGFGADLREETAFANLAREVEVVFRVAEGTGHAAAASVEVDDGRAGDFCEQGLCGGQQAHRFLVAMSVQQNLGWSRLQLQRHLRRIFLE